MDNEQLNADIEFAEFIASVFCGNKGVPHAQISQIEAIVFAGILVANAINSLEKTVIKLTEEAKG